MTLPSDIVERIRTAAGVGERPGAAPDPAKVKELAAQFESMLLVQMLRDMRQAGRWDDEADGAGLGAETFFETLDVELAGYLARAKGFGLAEQLEAAIAATSSGRPAGSSVGEPSPAARPAPSTEAAVVSTAVASEKPATPLEFAVPRDAITSGYGWRRDPFTGKATFHRGIDVRAAYGADVQSAGEGRVVFAGTQGGYGTTVVVDHGNGVRTRYAHLSAAIVQTGDTVRPGQVLGRAGQSGRATGTHLHFEVLKDGRQVPPEDAGLTAPSGD